MVESKRLIIDGNNFIYRAYYTKRPAKLLNGINTTPIHQFLYMIKNLVKNHPETDEIYITWDQKINSNAVNFRKDEVDYKSHRIETDETKEVLSFIPHIKKFTDALGIKTVFPYNLEADDVIFFLVDFLSDDKHNIIISSDKDLLQLVNDNTSIFLPKRDVLVTVNNFEEVCGIKREAFLLYKCILGDQSDNIPGLQKYGKVRAKKLAEMIHEEGEFAHITFLKNKKNITFLNDDQKEIIERNIHISELSYVKEKYPDEYEKCRQQYVNLTNMFDSERLEDLFTIYGFVKYNSDMGEWTELFDFEKSTKSLLSMITL